MDSIIRVKVGILTDERYRKLKGALRGTKVLVRSRKTKVGRSIYLFIPWEIAKEKFALAVT